MEYFVQGFLVTMGLIVAIGAQNAFVLKQALLKHHIFWISLTCFLCDIILMCLGVFGLGMLISQSQVTTVGLSFLGGLFLFVYGYRAFKSAYQGTSALALEQSNEQTSSAAKAVLLTLAVTLLNPHVYIDTVVIIGGIAGTLDFQAKCFFIVGALCTSALWFFGLGYGARLLIPFFQKPMTWRILDTLIGMIMWAIAYSLLSYGIQVLYSELSLK